jgi:hypothetical protein
MIRRAAGTLVLLALLGAEAGGEVLWKDNDDQPIPAPAADERADYIWWDGTWSMTYYQLRKVLDLGLSLHTVAEWARVVSPREATNVNALDEVPDSTWFTNRHALHRLSADELARGPNRGKEPAASGPLVILSGKAHGMTPGFVMMDSKGDRYVVKFDPSAYPDVPTGAEMVCTKILHALGWNVPENHLFRFDPARLRIDGKAWIKDRYNRKHPFTNEDLAKLLSYAAHEEDGSVRTLASRFIAGEPKGPFRTLGLRSDDPNDTVPHEDRRELRGLRVAAAWINFTDARRGNFYDSFVKDGSDERGHLVHYVLDFSSALGSGNDDWKSPQYGHEYYFDPPKVLLRALTLGFVRPAWASVPLAHPALGYLDAETFDPEEWVTSYPNPLFDQSTLRDSFWGAKLVASIRDQDLRAITAAGEWSDPATAAKLFEILRERQRKIARTYFDWRRINPVDGFAVETGELRYTDLAVESGVADAGSAQYRFRRPGTAWQTAKIPRAVVGGREIELETSRDGAEHWSPTTRVVVDRDGEGRTRVTKIERETE